MTETVHCVCLSCRAQSDARVTIAESSVGLGEASWLFAPRGFWLLLPIYAGQAELKAVCAACVAKITAGP
jgi:hypothetical protein